MSFSELEWFGFGILRWVSVSVNILVYLVYYYYYYYYYILDLLICSFNLKQ